MKKVLFTWMCLTAMLMAGTTLKAQEVTINLMPGWTWISYSNAEVLDIATALGDFVPAEGDLIKSQYGVSEYHEGNWTGSLEHFTPGVGYMYYSNRTTPISFVFGKAAPYLNVTTAEPTDITVNSATCGGDVVLADVFYVFVQLKGICWSTAPNPAVNDNFIEAGNGLGSFTVSLTDLSPGTLYYVRAFAVTADGTFYGDEVSFTTFEPVPIGAIDGLFSVSATHQVRFSQGNLQYIGSAATPYWKFADHQWEYFGSAQNGFAQNIDRDIFCWGTSGWDNGNLYYQPYDTAYIPDSEVGYGYGPTDGTNYDYSLTGVYANADWGVYNAIVNGGNQPNQWRTLTVDEWRYLFITRTTSSGIRYAKARVNGVGGIVLLPDNWDSSIYALDSTNIAHVPYSTNVISAANWSILETNGAVFLPAAGRRNRNVVLGGGWEGCYWTATSNSPGFASYLTYSDGSLYYPNEHSGVGKSACYAVRVVSVSLPEVSTLSTNDISGKSAIVWGLLTKDGNADVSPCGVCCSTSHNPTINDIVGLNQNATTGIGEFSAKVEGLTPNTTYYARVFATNSAGTAYGNEISFTTSEMPTWTDGALQGMFSVSADQQVQFSQGNLQYIGSAATPYWKFADYQWEYLGASTGQCGDSENVDRDYFGWGTSGYNHGAVCYQPWSMSQNSSDYYAYGVPTYNLADSTGMADWGYNPISNGGNQENQWRTLTRNEWNYLINWRSTTSGIRYAKAQVFGVNGVIFLPDDWNEDTYSLNNPNISTASFSSNVITASQWNVIEAAGAVFLPVAGTRSLASLGNPPTTGFYWLGTYFNDDKAGYMSFSDTFFGLNSNASRYGGYSVRLARYVEN